MPEEKLKIDPIYFTDDYPRVGCSLVVVVGEDGCSMRALAPNGRTLESYRPPKAEIGRYVQEWVAGIVPRFKPSDRSLDLPSLDKAD
jgi:hypothetical protein